jgi:hypothetical protein
MRFSPLPLDAENDPGVVERQRLFGSDKVAARDHLDQPLVMVEAADMGKVLLATVHAHRGLLSIEPILARYRGVFLISYGITTHKQAIPTQLSQG